MGRQPSWAISSNVRWAWRLSKRLIWLQSFWNSDIYSSPKFRLFGGTSSFFCAWPWFSFSLMLFLFFLVPPCSSHYFAPSLCASHFYVGKLPESWRPHFTTICHFYHMLVHYISFLKNTRAEFMTRISKEWDIQPVSNSSCMQNSHINKLLACAAISGHWRFHVLCEACIRRTCACVMPLHILTPLRSDILLLI